MKKNNIIRVVCLVLNVDQVIDGLDKAMKSMKNWKIALVMV